MWCLRSSFWFSYCLAEDLGSESHTDVRQHCGIDAGSAFSFLMASDDLLLQSNSKMCRDNFISMQSIIEV